MAANSTAVDVEAQNGASRRMITHPSRTCKVLLRLAPLANANIGSINTTKFTCSASAQLDLLAAGAHPIAAAKTLNGPLSPTLSPSEGERAMAVMFKSAGSYGKTATR